MSVEVMENLELIRAGMEFDFRQKLEFKLDIKYQLISDLDQAVQLL